MASLSFLLLASFLLSPTPFLSSGFAVPLLLLLLPRSSCSFSVLSLFYFLISPNILSSAFHFTSCLFHLLQFHHSSPFFAFILPSFYYILFYIHPFCFYRADIPTSSFIDLSFQYPNLSFFSFSVPNEWKMSERKCSIVCIKDPPLIMTFFQVSAFHLIPLSDLRHSYSCIIVLKSTHVCT